MPISSYFSVLRDDRPLVIPVRRHSDNSLTLILIYNGSTRVFGPAQDVFDAPVLFSAPSKVKEGTPEEKARAQSYYNMLAGYLFFLRINPQRPETAPKLGALAAAKNAG